MKKSELRQIIREEISKVVSENDISLSTTGGQDGKLYSAITNIVKTLRNKNFKDNEIEKFLLEFVKQTIKEV
jgi:microsomal dipeptidase-like Zn-dependent dipeptidase